MQWICLGGGGEGPYPYNVTFKMPVNAAKKSWMVQSGMIKVLRHGACTLGGRETNAMDMMVWRRCCVGE